jgi:mannose-1-phosphate guanylyltransferase/phosphomannomutase
MIPAPRGTSSKGGRIYMNAVIMAGGFGTRLRPLTSSLPKPMVPVGGKPLMQHVVERLSVAKLNRQVALLFFQPQCISDYFGDGSRFGVEMRYRRAEADYGTAGSVRNALDLLDDRFLIISGDVLTDFDLTQAIAFHEDQGALVTMVLTRMTNPPEYGVVITDDRGHVVRFLEKPSWGEVFSDTINTGIYILEKEALAVLPPKTNVDFSKDLFPRLLREGAPLYGYIADGYWRDIGNLEEYAHAHDDLLTGRVQVTFPGQRRTVGGATLYADPTAVIAGDAVLSGTVVLGPRSVVEAGAHLGDVVVGGDSVIENGASLLRAVLWDRVQVGAQAQLRQTVVCNEVLIGAGAQLSEGTVISERVTVGAGVQVRPNIRIWPGKEIEAGATVTDSLVWGDKFNRELFTDAKISGVFNREFTPEFGVRLGGAWGAQLGTGKTVLASRDDSPASRLLTRSIGSGLCAAGVHVHDLSTVPVPVLRHLLSVGMYAGGFHVRRSLEHAQWSDFIAFDLRGRDLGIAEAKSIERLFKREDYHRAEMDATGRIEYPIRVLEGYRAAFLSAVDAGLLRKRAFRVVVDYRRGIAGSLLGGLLLDLGIDTVTIDTGPERAQRAPGAEGGDAVQLGTVVSSLGCDLGVRIHPHAEKFTLFDENGAPLDPLEMQRVVAYLFLSRHPGTVVATPVVGSGALDDLAARFGGRVLRLRNDHQAMMEAHAGGADLVIGTRGGLISQAFGPGADGLFGFVYVLSLLAQSGLSLAAARREVQGYAYAETSAHCPWEKRGLVMRRLSTWAADNDALTLDGVRAVEEDGWIWVGPDRYKAQFNLVAESRKSDYVERRLSEIAEQVSAWQKN